ncbi:MAG TPA: hypothetical protein VGF67_16345 [Ktedonobacteraceae bacterium]
MSQGYLLLRLLRKKLMYFLGIRAENSPAIHLKRWSIGGWMSAQVSAALPPKSDRAGRRLFQAVLRGQVDPRLDRWSVQRQACQEIVSGSLRPPEQQDRLVVPASLAQHLTMLRLAYFHFLLHKDPASKICSRIARSGCTPPS